MKKIIVAVILMMVVIVIILINNNINKTITSEALQFVQQMGAGINLGNSLDSTRLKQYKEDASILEYETFWGNPPIAEELFQTIKSSGFDTVRIPVSWEEHLDENYVIDPVWMSRVREVVLQGIEHDLYVILDTHHESWLIPTLEKEEETTKILGCVWEQIANNFGDIGEKLLFEGMNEPRYQDSVYEWNHGTEEMRDVVNRLNQAFVDTIRSADGYNKERYLLITPYGSAHYEDVLTDLVVPKDEHIIVSVHAYVPYTFSLDEAGTNQWSSTNSKDTKEITTWIKLCYQQFIKKGIPVILTEFSCLDKDNLDARLEWTQFYVDELQTYQINYIWWDNLLDRYENKWIFPEIVSILTQTP